MKVTTQEQDNCEVILTVEIDDRQKNRLLEKAARRIARQVKIPGFRPGKAPYRIVVNKFGVEAVQEEAMTDLTQDIFQKALKEAEVTPFAQASLDEIEWEPLVMKVKVPTQPVVELGPYQDIRIEFEVPEVTEEELNEEIERLRDRHSTWETVERAAQLGDLAAVTASEKDLASGDMLAEERDFNITLLEREEDDSLSPDLSAHLVGMSAGEQKVFNHTYPEDYAIERFIGKEVEVFVRLNEVQEKELIEIDDDFAALVGDYDTLDDLKQGVQVDLVSRKQHETDRDLLSEVMDQVMAGVTAVRWPVALEEQEIEHALANRRQDLTRQGLDLQTYLQMQGQSEEELREELRANAQQSIKQSLVLNKVIELEGLQIDPEQVAQQAELMIMMSGGTQEAIDTFRSPAGLQMMASTMIYETARHHLLRIAKGEIEAEEARAAEEAKAAEEVAAAEAEAAADVAIAGDIIEGEATAVEELTEADASAAETNTETDDTLVDQAGSEQES